MYFSSFQTVKRGTASAISYFKPDFAGKWQVLDNLPVS